MFFVSIDINCSLHDGNDTNLCSVILDNTYICCIFVAELYHLRRLLNCMKIHIVLNLAARSWLVYFATPNVCVAKIRSSRNYSIENAFQYAIKDATCTPPID